MARKEEDSENHSILSFIDVISCGMGAAVLLYLIFSALPHSGSIVPSGQRNLTPGGHSIEDRPVGIESPLSVKVAQLPIEVSVTMSGLFDSGNGALELRGITRRERRYVITKRQIGSVAELALETKVFSAQGLHPANRVIGVFLPRAMLRDEVDEYCVNVRLISAKYYSKCVCFNGEKLRNAGLQPNLKLFNLYAVRDQKNWIQVKVPGFDKDISQYVNCPE